MDASLKRRSSAFSPQKVRNWDAFAASLAGGPWSTRRRLDSGSIRRPMVKVVGVWVGAEASEKDTMGGEVTDIRVTRVVRAVCRIDVVPVREVKA